MASAAAHYQEQAAKMRTFAESANDPSGRRQFLELADQYDNLAARAEQRQVGSGSSSGTDA